MQNLTMLQVTKLIRMSENCIRRWMSLGFFPKGLMIERKRLWDEEELKLWMQNELPALKQKMKSNKKKKKVRDPYDVYDCI